jgi:spore coat protein CotH
MDIIYNGPSRYNTLPYPFNNTAITQSLGIGIHLRGQTSRAEPKQQYAVEVRNAQGKKEALSLFGLPAHSKWVLYASSVDASLMRNRLAFHLFSHMQRYAPRTQYVEVFFAYNDTNVTYPENYGGIYMLEEKNRAGTN